MSVARKTLRSLATGAVNVGQSDAVALVKAVSARLSARAWAFGEFSYGRYPHTFLERRPPDGVVTDGAVPNLIWTFWTGDNALTPARKAGLEAMRALNPHTPVELVDPSRLDEFIVDGSPLHPGYKYLSLNHRSDYLRAYFLLHYGGAYSDIKTLKWPWREAISRMAADPTKWVAGTALSDPKWAGNVPGRLGRHVRRYYEQVLSGGTLIARAGTPLLAEWVREIERVLDYALPALREAPGGTWGESPAYPLEWMTLQGNIFQPLCLKYQSKISIDPTLSWNEKVDYR